MDCPPVSLAGYFDDKFAANADPWRYRESWYEARKRALLLAALPRARYRGVFEPGCAIGALSAELARRCEHLLCADLAPRAVATARARLAAFPHADVQTLAMPHDWPAGRFDLIVVSEFAYYLNAADCTALAALAASSLETRGTLACCHWRHGGETWMLESAQVHGIFAQAAANALLHGVVQIEDADFLLDVWSRDALSVAHREHA
ncbi:SAM-dependent methyltransferase [Paraburkholderia lycopersici]|uniref:Nodulation protein S (NodS) n=1 Tax=Paraburkholderia lycopersici TaxID=416944 RepID=A0A1G7BZQ7_9BURK|nr:SAM-dependent methyltransferase [Paraburkholderia lycopersici]SDE32527.1 Nodulation protein S (NodS) [Paraburkholderia lycopersici]